MDKQSQSFGLSQALDHLIKIKVRGFKVIDGIVTGVNDDYTVDITVQDVPFSSVPIAVLIGTQASIYPIPVVGTSCLVTFRDGNINLPQILAFDQVDTLKINCTTKVEFNGGQLGGMVLVNKLVQDINDLKATVRDLISKYNSHTHILTLSSGTGTAAPTTTSETGTINNSTASNLQNPKITQ